MITVYVFLYATLNNQANLHLLKKKAYSLYSGVKTYCKNGVNLQDIKLSFYKMHVIFFQETPLEKKLLFNDNRYKGKIKYICYSRFQLLQYYIRQQIPLIPKIDLKQMCGQCAVYRFCPYMYEYNLISKEIGENYQANI